MPIEYDEYGRIVRKSILPRPPPEPKVRKARKDKGEKRPMTEYRLMREQVRNIDDAIKDLDYRIKLEWKSHEEGDESSVDQIDEWEVEKHDLEERKACLEKRGPCRSIR